ncbi:sodium/pantothenate symporter, partial [uncultured Cetobacterium sp.]|uniref:sodium/pantothenate symporter n=1 Tax=uncultured Cetobacterium sp. TaxID=527638 RepID=UPI0026370020
VIQGGFMLIAAGILFFTLLKNGGGMENIMRTVGKINPDLLTPNSGGAIAKPFILSFWMLVGIAILGLPATSVRCMGFKDSKSMHNAMIIGTSVVGILMLIMHLIGVMGIAISPNLEIGDKIIPTLAIGKLHPILAGVFIGGPLAAIMSTVDSFLILSSATIVKDLYINYINPNPKDEKIKKISLMTSLIIGIIVFIFALNPPKLLVWINLFALAGQEAAFFCPIIFGLYWKRANATGALLSMIFGILFFLYLTIFKVNVFGMHHIVPVISLNIFIFIIGSLLGKKVDNETIDTFFNFD